MDIYKKIYQFGIVPVVALEHLEDAIPLTKALCEGGLEVVEITYRTACAKDAIANIHQIFPDILIGAGTILTIKQAESAYQAGAQFIVTPGFNEEVVEYCISNKIPIIPGCSSASDVEKALRYGLDIVKFFPAEASGGIASIKALSVPYPMMKFMPTGGINESNVTDYLKFKKVLACGGSWMVSSTLINQHEFEKIKVLTRQAIMKMLELQIVCFDYEKDMTVISTSQLERALFHLSRWGLVFDDQYCAKLKLYLKEVD